MPIILDDRESHTLKGRVEEILQMRYAWPFVQQLYRVMPRVPIAEEWLYTPNPHLNNAIPAFYVIVRDFKPLFKALHVLEEELTTSKDPYDGYDCCTLYVIDLMRSFYEDEVRYYFGDPFAVVKILKKRFSKPVDAYNWLLKPHMLLFGLPPATLIMNKDFKGLSRLINATPTYLN